MNCPLLLGERGKGDFSHPAAQKNSEFFIEDQSFSRYNEFWKLLK